MSWGPVSDLGSHLKSQQRTRESAQDNDWLVKSSKLQIVVNSEFPTSIDEVRGDLASIARALRSRKRRCVGPSPIVSHSIGTAESRGMKKEITKRTLAKRPSLRTGSHNKPYYLKKDNLKLE